MLPFGPTRKPRDVRFRAAIGSIEEHQTQVRDCAATMVVAAGVETQEYTYLDLEACKALIRCTLEAVGGRVPVMVGITHPPLC